MTSQTVPNHILQVLLEQVEDILNRYKRGLDANNQLEILLEKIEGDLEEIKSVFHIPKECEDAFKSLAKDLNDLYLDDHGRTEEETTKKLSHISHQLQDIKRSSHAQLPEAGHKESLSQLRQSTSVPPRKKSANWLQIEKQLLLGKMMDNIQLSYELLPVKLRLCSLFFSVFPEGAIIKKKPLIYWWIGEGFITKTSSMTAEEAGEEAFRELMDKGLIQAYHKRLKSPVISGCTMNPWIHRMLISNARQANFFDFSEDGKITDSYQKSRRALKEYAFEYSTDSNLKGELQAIFNMTQSYPSINEESFSKVENLKVLQLGRWQRAPIHHIEIEDSKFLDKLETQKQLKYLSLRGISRITALPPSVLGCQNLEILDLKACHNLEQLPSDLGSLKKLTHFIVSECCLLEGLPKALEKISSLQVYKGFVIDHWRKNPCQLSSIIQLEKLRKLSMNVGKGSKEQQPKIDEKSRKYADKEVQKLPSMQIRDAGKILKLENLRVLAITWQMSSLTEKEDLEKSVNPFGSVSFPMLEKLDLKCFPGRTLPLWISPQNSPNLKRLYIRGGRLEALFPPDSSPAYLKLEILRLNYLKNFQFQPANIVSTVAPSLLYFERIKCHQSSGGTFDADIEWRSDDGWPALMEKLENVSNA